MRCLETLRSFPGALQRVTARALPAPGTIRADLGHLAATGHQCPTDGVTTSVQSPPTRFSIVLEHPAAASLNRPPPARSLIEIFLLHRQAHAGVREQGRFVNQVGQIGARKATGGLAMRRDRQLASFTFLQ